MRKLLQTCVKMWELWPRRGGVVTWGEVGAMTNGGMQPWLRERREPWPKERWSSCDPGREGAAVTQGERGQPWPRQSAEPWPMGRSSCDLGREGSHDLGRQGAVVTQGGESHDPGRGAAVTQGKGRQPWPQERGGAITQDDKSHPLGWQLRIRRPGVKSHLCFCFRILLMCIPGCIRWWPTYVSLLPAVW